MRIVSLLPSATEIVCALGLRDSLVGVTHECDHPDSVLGLPKVTRTRIPIDASSRQIDALVRERLGEKQALYSLDMETLQRLRPDLIVTQALCDVCAVAEREVQAATKMLPGAPRVLNLEPTRLADVLAAISEVGRATGRQAQAKAAIERLQTRIEAVAARTREIIDRPRVMLLEWLEPPFTSGHWNPELVELAGGREVLGKTGERSRETCWPEIAAADPEVMVIACCGFNVERTASEMHVVQGQGAWQSLACVRAGRVHLVDGNAYFSRPGPRLVDSLEILAAKIHPEMCEQPS